MSQPPIHLAAIVVRDGRLALFRGSVEGGWALPGGAFPAGVEDVDEAMDAVLHAHGINAPAIEDDFLQTVYLPLPEGGHALLNLYAPSEWKGEPAHPEGHERGWFGIDEIADLAMEERVKRAIFSAFGWDEDADDADLMRALASGLDPFAAPPPASAPDPGEDMESLMMLEALEFGGGGTASPEPLPFRRPESEGTSSSPAGGTSSRHEAGLDVLRTLSGGDAELAEARLRRNSPEIAPDIVDWALGEVWSNPALDRRTRSLLVVAMLTAMGGRGGPLRSHINGALNHGATPAQIVETLRMAGVYAGLPAALEAWPVMEEVFAARDIPRPGGAS